MTSKFIFVVEMDDYPQAESNFDNKDQCWSWVGRCLLSREMEAKCKVVEYVRKN